MRTTIEIDDKLLNAAISAPTLVMSASEDYTPLAWKEAMVRRIPYATLLVVPDTRHAIPLEKPGEFNRIVNVFLQSGSNGPIGHGT